MHRRVCRQRKVKQGKLGFKALKGLEGARCLVTTYGTDSDPVPADGRRWSDDLHCWIGTCSLQHLRFFFSCSPNASSMTLQSRIFNCALLSFSAMQLSGDHAAA